MTVVSSLGSLGLEGERRQSRRIPGAWAPHRALPPALDAGLFAELDQAAALACACLAMAQRKPTISRAIAVVTTTFAFPVAASRLYRAQSLTCAFQAMSQTACGSLSSRSCSG